MKRALFAMVAVVSVTLLGCGGPAVVEEPESTEAPEVSQQAVCTAVCSGGTSVSCSGTTCSSTDYQGVTCNGVFKACPATGPGCAPGLPTCQSLQGLSCRPVGANQECCWGTYSEICSCNAVTTGSTYGKWGCY